MKTIWSAKDPLVMYFVAETEIERIWIAMFQNRDKAIKVVSSDMPGDVYKEALHCESNLDARAEAIAMQLMDDKDCEHGNGTPRTCSRCLGIVGFELRTGESRAVNIKNKSVPLSEEDIPF